MKEKSMTDIAITQEIAQTLYKNKANNILALDVRELTVICDYMVIASGRNANQVKALSDDVDERMAELGLTLRRSEGANEGRWIILDYGHIMVHIFHQEERQFYNLERLWEDGNNRLVLPFDQTTPD
ncbi:MAG: ribosome silencing factor [Clostridiales bacterium]|nr:ribosome silencing factor [Clostridiales bacterium]